MQSHHQSSRHLQSKRPVRSSQGADEVGSSGSEHIVNSVGRGDDALATRLGRVSCEPADDVSSFLVVERLLASAIK